MISNTKTLILAGIVIILVLLAISIAVSSVSNYDSGKVFESIGKPTSIAIVKLEGEISYSEESGFIKQDSIVEQVKADLDAAEENPNVGAIVLEINSPGGSVVATKEIVNRILKSEKPIVSYITEVGASGGYYIAAATNEIYSDEDSITGSIGVIAMLPNFEELMEKIGVKFKVFKEGKFKDLGSPFRELTLEEEELYQAILSEAFENFKNDIRKYRGDKLDQKMFDKVADGRIMTGRQALKYGLIDGTGPKDIAIKRAATLAGIKDYPKIVYIEGKSASFLDIFAKAGYSFGSGFKVSIKEDISSIQGIKS